MPWNVHAKIKNNNNSSQRELGPPVVILCSSDTSPKQWLITKIQKYVPLYSIYDILGTVWRNNIKVSVTCYQQLTACYQQITNSWLTVGFLSADKLPTVCQLSQQTTNGQLTDGRQTAKRLFWELFFTITSAFSCRVPSDTLWKISTRSLWCLDLVQHLYSNFNDLSRALDRTLCRFLNRILQDLHQDHKRHFWGLLGSCRILVLGWLQIRGP